MARRVYTEEEREAAAKASQRRYRSSPKYQAARAAARERERARDRERYAQNVSGRRDKMHAWNATRQVKNKKLRKVYTPEERKEAERRWRDKYRSSPEVQAARKAYQKAYLQTEAGRASQARGYQNSKRLTPEKKAAKAARLARWYATPKGKARIAANNLRRRTDGKIDSAVLAAVQSTRVCYYCGVGISVLSGRRYDSCRLTVDHLIPLARGGSSERDNLVGACSGCNSAKCDLMAEEFFAAGLRLNGGV